MTACVKTLMDEISSLDWDIVAKDDFEYSAVEDDIKEVKEFLEHPNHNADSFADLLRALIKDILEIDAGVIVKVFDIGSYEFEELEPKSGAPMLKGLGKRHMTELYIRDGASFLKEIDKFGFIKGYWQYSYQIPAHPMWFNEPEIVYVSEHNRSMSCYGYARTQGILDIVKSLVYGTVWNRKFFEETAIPDGAISLLDTSEDEMQKFRSYINNEFKAQPHKIAVLNKDMKWQQWSVTQKELDFLETQKWYLNIIISMFGLTPAELGITDNLNRATSATQAELVKRKGVRPFLKLLENVINKGILPEFQHEGIQFQFIYDDPAEKTIRLANWQSELNMGVKTVNEVREEMGLAPIEGGDISNSMAQRMISQVPGQEGMTPQESSQSPGYKDQVRGQEAANAPKKNETEQKKQLDQAFNDNSLPNANFKSATVEIDPVQLQMGIEVEREHQDSLTLSDEQVRQIALDHLKEDPQYYTKLREMESKKKSVEKPNKEMRAEYLQMLRDESSFPLREKGYVAPVGQYYNDQPISQQRRNSGANFQPQNQSHPMVQGPMTPSHLGDSFAVPGKTTWNSEKDKIHCPICGMATLTYLSSLENLPEDVRCTQCGARFKGEDLINSKVMEEMYNVVTANNQTRPAVKPDWQAKSFTKEADDDLDVKAFCGFDVSKSFPHSVEFADSREYRKKLSLMLKDMDVDSIDKLIKILLYGFRTGKSIREMAGEITELGIDPERAMLIARTEVIRIGNEGNLKRMEEKGTEEVEYISAPEDGRLCSKCKEHDRKIYKLKDAQGLLPLHPRCRCSLTEHYSL